MTNEQAKSIFLLEYCSQRCGTQYRRHCDNCEINLAMKALEKQIPKKPFLESTKGITPIAIWHCPVCKDEIISNWNRDIANPYCHHCGQAIDWSEEE